MDATKEEQGAGTYIFIALCCVFVAAVLGCTYEVLRSAREDKKRRRARAGSTSSQRWQPPYNDSVIGTTGVKSVGFKSVSDDDKRPNGTHTKPLSKDYKPLLSTDLKADIVNDKKVHMKGTS